MMFFLTKNPNLKLFSLEGGGGWMRGVRGGGG